MMAFLRRRLHPLKPILGPIWRRIRISRKTRDRWSIRAERLATEA
jgi:hypothetical protein